MKEPYNVEKPFYYSKTGKIMYRELDHQNIYLLKGETAGLIWDIAWLIKNWIGFTKDDKFGNIDDLPIDKLISLCSMLANSYTEGMVIIVYI